METTYCRGGIAIGGKMNLRAIFFLISSFYQLMLKQQQCRAAYDQNHLFL
jgi:hypothetical protein